MSPVENEAVVCEILRAASCLVPSVELNLLIHFHSYIFTSNSFKFIVVFKHVLLMQQIGKGQLMRKGPIFWMFESQWPLASLAVILHTGQQWPQVVHLGPAPTLVRL